MTFTDGPEILTAVSTLGVAHPTGYPVFTVVAHFFAAALALPIKPCLKVEAFNALCGVLAALFTAAAARIVVVQAQGVRDDAERWEADVAGLLTGLILGVSPLLWEQVRIPEVYPFHVFLVTAAVYALLRFEVTRDERYILLAALPMGTGLAHHVTMVYLLPATFLYLLMRRPMFLCAWLVQPLLRLGRVFRKGLLAGRNYPGGHRFLLACVIGGLPLLSYGYLIWANKHSAGVTWGDVHDWKSLYAHMTGAQYRRFMHGFGEIFRWDRVKKVPDYFDMQFLPIGTGLFLVGLYATFRRARVVGGFLLAYLLLNIAHTLQYSVGDYANYYLPGIYCCALYIAVGLAVTLRFARARAAEVRRPLCFRAIGLGLLSVAIAVLIYAKLTPRVTPPLDKHVVGFLSLPLGALGLLALGGEVVERRKRWPAWARRAFPSLGSPMTAAALPAVVAGLVLAVYVPVAGVRAYELGSQTTIGESYGEELARNIPRGSVLMTQGDGFLFTMWYEAHVLGLAKDFITLDMGNLKTAWYQKYIKAKNPAACDPLAPAFVQDPASYERTCGSYAQRMSLPFGEPWASMGIVGRKKAPKDRKEPLDDRVRRGADARCEDPVFHKAHYNVECWCWDFSKKTGIDEEFCVHSADEGGIVPREYIEVHAQRIIEDHLDERPVFERNTLTNWGGETDSARGWEGPSYQRVSGEYTLVNRGRFNQVLYTEDVRGQDPCAGSAYPPIRSRALRPPRPKSKVIELRRPYVPNDWPTLISASFLTRTAAHQDDAATRSFTAGDTVHLQIDWFEKVRYDPSRKGHKGAPLRHGLRFCFIDPEGHKVAEQAVISGQSEPAITFATTADARPGTYRIEGCSVGDRGTDGLPLPDALRCVRPILEYTFTVEPR